MHATWTSQRPSAGFTLIEVMIALTVLVGALLLTVGQHANVATLQRRTQDAAAVDRILQSLVNRVNSVTWSHLATTRAPWSIARIEELDATGTFHQPLGSAAIAREPMTFRLTDDAGAAIDQARDGLVGLGLCSTTDGPPDLRVYVEYYRAMDFVDSTGALQEGLLDEGADSSQEFRTAAYVDPRRPELGIRAAYDLAGWDPSDTSEGNSPGMRSAILDPAHPILIRLIAVWEDRDPDPQRFIPTQRRELFTARAP